MFEIISSFQNPRVKLIKKLREKKHREREARFVIDYDRDLARALECGFKVDFVFFCPELSDTGFDIDVPHDHVFEVPREVMEKVSYRKTPSSIVAVMHQKSLLDFTSLDEKEFDSMLVLVDLRKPGNIGALFRTADAVGISAVLLVDSQLDIYNPNIIRSSTGASFSLDIVALTSEEAIDFLRRRAYQIFSTHLEGTTSLFDVRFPRKSAIVLGTEDRGLDKVWVDSCDMLVRIPMEGKITDSLNVSVTGAICMYEMFRQHTR